MKVIATELKMRIWFELIVLDQGVGHANLKGVFLKFLWNEIDIPLRNIVHSY